METGSKIKQYLLEHGISQAFVSRTTGIPAPKLNLSLNGRRRLSFDEYERICGTLGVGVDTFITPQRPQITL